MKRISRETNIAFSVMFITSLVATFYNLHYWFFMASVFCAYVIPIIVIYIIKKRRKRKKWFNFYEAEMYKNFENKKMRQYPLTKDECFDSKEKVKWFTMDEPMMWKEATPQEAEQAKMAYEEWKQATEELKDAAAKSKHKFTLNNNTGKFEKEL